MHIIEWCVVKFDTSKSTLRIQNYRYMKAIYIVNFLTVVSFSISQEGLRPHLGNKVNSKFKRYLIEGHNKPLIRTQKIA